MKKLHFFAIIAALFNSSSFAESITDRSHENRVFDISNNSLHQIETLSNEQMQETQGAVAPLVLVGLNVAGRFTASQVFSHYTRNIGLAYGTYSLGNWLCDRSGRGPC